MTTKAQTYTPEQTQQIVEAYQAGKTVEAIAEQVGKSARSIVAKLSREGVYQAKTRATQTPRVRKADLVDQIAARLEVDAELVESLEKATTEALEVLLRGLCRE
jgi:transposase-like protein